MAKSTATLGIDIGGSKSLVALVDGGTVRDSREMPTVPVTDPAVWIDAARQAAAPWDGTYDNVAAAVSGLVTDGTWRALNLKTLQFSGAYPLLDRIGEAFQRPVFAVNDAQAAAWGEYRFGAGVGRDLVFLTISTGLGGGIVLDGALRRGARQLAGHFGLVPPDLTRSGPGDRIEDQATGRWMVTEANRQGRSVAEARAVFAAARDGAAWADAIIEESARRVSRLCAAIQLTFDTDLIVVGGGIGLAPGYLDRVTKQLEAIPPDLRPELRPAQLGAHAGVVGAADLAHAIPTDIPHQQEES
ncbi:ROK family protein [Bauldia sp.]|uniref:ROK family protein n=1 Tax=Bauldia sp. TaxID=2575872 RepID=UPI003BAB1573